MLTVTTTAAKVGDIHRVMTAGDAARYVASYAVRFGKPQSYDLATPDGPVSVWKFQAAGWLTIAVEGAAKDDLRAAYRAAYLASGKGPILPRERG
jgi:hypothetical protein